MPQGRGPCSVLEIVGSVKSEPSGRRSRVLPGDIPKGRIHMDTSARSFQCCIAGGGPAGMMLGFLLARAGIDVAVLEKHADFFRDFRGDTIHPSTLELMYELGLLEDFLSR